MNLVLLGTFKNFSNTLGNAWSNILRKDSRLVWSGISLSLFDYDLLFELSQNILMPYLYLTSLTLAHGPGVMTPQARRNSSLHTNQTLISRDTKYEWEENLYV